jgi:predicted enzyme related to lactoylglutathione lyase
MRERDRYPAGVPCWIDTNQPDPKPATEFYGGLFGWSFTDQGPEAGPSYFIGTIDDLAVAGVGHQPEGAPEGPAWWNQYVAVESADDAAAKVKGAGGEVKMEPFDIPDAGRMSVLADPEGATFCVWEAKGMPGAALVNEYGTFNFSELNTRDVDSAAKFYADAFGWEMSSFEADGAQFQMFRLPGYGEHLEQRNPGFIESMAEQDAPEGFADVVAAILPMDQTGMPAEVPPHWSITFSVEDADASAEKAGELGGAVVAGPMDAGPTRRATVTDPAGAAFGISRYYSPGER